MTASPPSSSYDWVREIQPDLKKLDSIPLTGTSQPFPWEELSLRLAHSFNCEGLSIEPKNIVWRSKQELYEGLGEPLFPLTFAIPSFNGLVSWVMSAKELSILTALLLTNESPPSSVYDDTLKESFYYFLALEVLNHLTQLPFDKTIKPILVKQQNLPDQDALCWDIHLKLQNHMILGRFIISSEFRYSWVKYFTQKGEASHLSQQIAQLTDVIVHLEAGKTQLTLAEWMSVRLGDFIICDNFSLNSDRFDGRITLTINGKQAFRAKLKDRTLKILELPLLHEAETFMTTQSDNEEDDLSDLNLSQDEDLFLDTDDLLENGEDVVSEDASDPTETQYQAQSIHDGSKIEDSTSRDKQILTPEQIPVTVVVEIGQVQLAIEQLLKLEPGNLLDVNVQPENGVDLTINGKIVGKGELIRVGEAIGVRILQLGR